MTAKLIGLALALTGLSAGQTALAQNTIGSVYKLQGNWYREGRSRLLTSNENLPAGSVIRIQSPSRLDFIVFLFTNGEVLEKRCSRGECDQPIQLPHYVQKRTSFWTVIIEPAVRMFRRNPGKYSVHMPKSGAGELKDAVVETRNGSADLAAVFGEMPKGAYTVRLERKANPGQASRKSLGAPTTVQWDPSGPSQVPFSGLRTGIYEVRLLEKQANNSYLPTPVSAWVLVSRPNRFEQTLSSFREALRLTSAWDTKMDQDSIRGFLRAYLDHLASKQNEAR